MALTESTDENVWRPHMRDLDELPGARRAQLLALP